MEQRHTLSAVLVVCGVCWIVPVRGQDLFLAADSSLQGSGVNTDRSHIETKRRVTKPNIVWFLTDDQDQQLGASFPPTAGETPMPKTKKLMQDGGTHATNWYIHTPICSPSRSELLTGRYFHNIKQTGGKGYCAGMHVNYSIVNERHFARILKEEAGYMTGMFGKYVNEMPTAPPPGFDAWLANGGGTYIAPKFQVQNIDGLPNGQVAFTNDPSNYTTAVVGNTSIAWIKKVAKLGKPFMAYIAPKAAHEPFNPAVWYKDHWDPSWPQHEPRPENWNCSAESRKNHHGNIASEHMITDQASRVITGVFRNRWRTLMSVDDMISEVIATVDELGLLDNTYFFYSSDHGFQLGQFNIPMDKRHVYEWDTKIHLLAKGPGITPGSTFDNFGTQVDIAPTLLGLAGLKAPETMDGKSIVPFLLDASRTGELPESTRQHLKALGDLHSYGAAWRQEVFIEYYYCDFNVKCVEGCAQEKVGYPEKDSNCANLEDNSDCWCGDKGRTNSSSDPSCYFTEDLSNNFIALRGHSGSTISDGNDGGQIDNVLYAEFQKGDLAAASINFDRVDFAELYDVGVDKWQMHNLANDRRHELQISEFHNRVHMWLNCAGASCP